ncbi:poly-gamma-glutamate biosynthesis protein PgsC/CapC [Legionella yabuuchiae]|uniref:poly-gamma-glutamate biosynthesis protein PgsC/CapC n=1 Tax=Legionella yabuuchiae TaxID=376727 RepID=UPI001056DBE3|nr:poly-gamma-glutamate biosynthesis protein PgsC/CapC [Legionella yabuuchiae]
MNIFPLQLFPYALSSSVITTVWIGVFVIAFFNLRLGWLLSGFVIPGYLVPLLIIKPLSVFVIFIEAVLTYVFVWSYSYYFTKFHHFNHLFGRDRFFALFLASVLVRVGMDGWVLPEIANLINIHFGIQIDYRDSLQSFGLIIVALISNQLWKSGLNRGLVHMLVTLFITYFIVRYVLINVTNFDVSNLQYMYANIAMSMLASPKSYIILIVTALIASRLNLRYGWEYNGILIPALLALQWYQPIKIVSSFVEAFIILGLSSALLESRFFRHRNIEGAYKLLLFFNVSFVYKIILAYLSFYFFPQVQVTDFYGFGYLLSTLIAIKMYDKHVLAHLTLSTLQTSIISVFVASIIGYSLTFVPQFTTQAEALDFAAQKIAPLPRKTNLEEALRLAKIQLYQNKLMDSSKQPTLQELRRFTQAINTLLALKSTEHTPELKHAQKQLSQIHYQIYTLENRYFLLEETPPVNGWGLYVIDTKASASGLIEVPRPLSEENAYDVGAALYARFKAKSFAVSGRPMAEDVSPYANVLANPLTFYQAFHKAAADENVIQVRTTSAPQLQTKIFIKQSLPPLLNLQTLKQWVGPMEIVWGKSASSNLQWDKTDRGFAEIVFTAKATNQLLNALISPQFSIKMISSNQNLEGYLLERVFKENPLADKGSNLYQAPSLSELLYFDREILTPLLMVSFQHDQSLQWTKDTLNKLKLINAQASAMGYQITYYHHKNTDEYYLILREIPELKERHYGGTFIIRLNQYNPYFVQIPRPVFEMNSFEYGLALFELLNARALFLAGAHPYANLDKSSDLLRYVNRHNLLNLATQTFLRETGDTPYLLIQSRAFGLYPNYPAPEADVLLSFDDGATRFEQFSTLDRQLIEAIKQMGLQLKMVGGSKATTGYEASGSYITHYFEQLKNKQLAILWLSPVTNTYFRTPEDNIFHEAKFNAANIPTVQGLLYSYLRSSKLGTSDEAPNALKQAIERYMGLQDIIILQSLVNSWPDYTFKRFIDENSRQPYLLVFDSSDRLLLVAHLAAPDPNSLVSIHTRTLPRQVVSDYIETRAAWLILENAP